MNSSRDDLPANGHRYRFPDISGGKWIPSQELGWINEDENAARGFLMTGMNWLVGNKRNAK